jgi:hypothetical protein
VSVHPPGLLSYSSFRLGDRLARVEVDGERALVQAEDVDELAAVQATRAVRLLPGFDQYVLGPGTADAHVISAARRRRVSKQSGWIASVVVAGGVVTGTWELAGEQVRIAWFEEAGRPPRIGMKGGADDRVDERRAHQDRGSR